MPNRTANIGDLRKKLASSGKRLSKDLVGHALTESGVLDRAVLNRQIAEILEGLAEKAAFAPRVGRLLEAFLRASRQGDMPRTAELVCALLSLELDDLRRAALLSLMVRLAGKRKFDPIASYILQNRKVLVTGLG